MLNDPYIEIDINKLKELKEIYKDAMAFIKKDLPFNPLSTLQVKNYFKNVFGLDIKSGKIEEIKDLVRQTPEFSKAKDRLQGTFFFLKMHYSTKNYIDHYLTKQSGGRVYITKNVFGYVQTNHRPLPSSPEILECVVGAGNGLELIRDNNNVPTGFGKRREL